MRNHSFLILTLVLMIFSKDTIGQSDVLEGTKNALKAGSSKDISKYFNDMVEIGLNKEDKKTYSKTQAEFILRDFFKQYPPTDFQYVHQGSSKEGMKYTIGKYMYNGGTFRVITVVKQFRGNYLIDYIVFEE